MPESVLALVFLIFIVAVFLLIACLVADSFAKTILFLVWIWLSTALLLSSLEELASQGAQYLHWYAPAKGLMTANFYILRLPLLSGGLQRVETASELARLALHQGKIEEARLWADKATELFIAEPKDTFETVSRMGAVYFDLGEFDRAKKLLERAMRLAELASSARGPFKTLEDDLSKWQAANLDLLAKIELSEGLVEEAEKLFRASARIRFESGALRDSAAAYEENFCGSLRLFQANAMEEASKHILQAARKLPDNLRPAQHMQVAYSILCNLNRIDAPEAQAIYDALLQRCKALLHPSQTQQLSSSLRTR